MKILRRLLIYFLLVAGSVVFVWPFLWMAATSAKLDRELFSESLTVWPERPIPRLQSPYLDDRLFENLRGPRLEEAVGLIEKALGAVDYPWPADLTHNELLHQTARGIYGRLLNTLPGEDWELSQDELRAKIGPHISTRAISEVVGQLRRVLCLGDFRAQSYDQEEDLLVPATTAATAWKVEGPGRAQLLQNNTPNEPKAELRYDFSNGDTIRLSQTFHPTFPLERLHRLQLSLQSDDTWHRLRLFVEKNGQRFRASRTLPLSDHEWVIDSWQEPVRTIVRQRARHGRCWSRMQR